MLGTASFMIQAFFTALFTPKLAGIFFSTSPPLIGLPMCIAGLIRRVPVVYWAMDLNPDQLIALGKINPVRSPPGCWKASIDSSFGAKVIVALDRFMADRLTARGVPVAKLLVLPPWSYQHIQGENNENPFRARHGLDGKFVIMYSGNHSPSNPLRTLLDAAVALKQEQELKFLFVGGGLGKKEVEACIRDHALTNMISLPYQPTSELKYSLTAADIHIVSLGEGMVGIIHPCKIYGAMSAGKPILFLGPRPSHISDLLEQQCIGMQVAHGDVPGALAAIDRLRKMPDHERRQMGDTARGVLLRR